MMKKTDENQMRKAHTRKAASRTPPLPKGKFGTIVADPPWSFSDTGSRIAPDAKETFKYLTMHPDEILALPVESIAADKAHLYLWTTCSHLKLALEVMEKWGFVYKLTLVWVKTGQVRTEVYRLQAIHQITENVSEVRQQIGMGHTFRHSHELCLFGTRGKLTAGSHSLPTVFFAARTKHSKKPEQLQDMAEKMSPSKRIELFATRKRKGWTTWGTHAPQEKA